MTTTLDDRAVRAVRDAGGVVPAGSFTRPTQAARGDTLPADSGPLGSVALRFV